MSEISFIPIIIVLIVIALAAAVLKNFLTPSKVDPVTGVAGPGAMFCPNCGHAGGSTSKTRGSILIEIVLWLCFIIPGLIYSIWRLTTRHKACPSCGAPNMIPANSPMAQRLRGSLTPPA